LAFSPDSSKLIISEGQRILTIKVDGWTVSNKLFGGLVPFEGKNYIFRAKDIDFAPNGDYIAAGFSRHALIGIIHFPSGEILKTIQIDPNNDPAIFARKIFQVTYSENGDYLAFSGHAGVGVIDVDSGELIHFSDESGRIATFSPTNDEIVFGQMMRDASTWEIVKQSIIPDVGSAINVFDDSPSEVSSSGRWKVEYEHETGIISLLDTKSSTTVYSVQGHEPIRHSYTGELFSISQIAFSPDETFFVTGGWDRRVKFWRIDEEPSSKLLGVMPDRVREIEVSSDSSLVAVGGGAQFKVWNVLETAGTLICGNNYDVTDLAFSPDTKILATDGKKEGLISIWRLSDCVLLDTLNNRKSVWNLQFSADGSKLYSRGNNLVFWWGAK
jgi:WD40 repeat protein